MWEVTPHWKNTGATDALELKSWWAYWFIDRHYDDFRKLQCPEMLEPEGTAAQVAPPGGEFFQLAKIIPVDQVVKALTHDAAILIGIHIEYRDIFYPDDPPRLIDSCDNLVPNDPNLDRFSWLSIRRTIK
jgi:hypothetical protein